MRMKRTGRSRVSAITQPPASGPFGPVTTPPMSSLSMVTACCACNEAGATQPTTAIPIAATPVKRILRIVMPLAVDGPRPGLAVAGEGGILETYFAQQHHITALISGQTPGHSIETFPYGRRPQERVGFKTSRTTPTPS